MLFKKSNKSQEYFIKTTSNIIQYDLMDKPLRLIIDNNGKQQWIDTEEKEDDLVLQWYSTNEEEK